jgi:hypothetical protein
LLSPGGKLIISIPSKFSIIRESQKFIRKLASVLGVDKYSYLSVSKFEIHLHELERWLGEYGFTLDRFEKFDPILPKGFQKLLRPSLLIVEAHKKKSNETSIT